MELPTAIRLVERTRYHDRVGEAFCRSREPHVTHIDIKKMPAETSATPIQRLRLTRSCR